MEDEFYFIMTCPLYCKEREEMISLTVKKAPTVSKLSLKDKFIWLMSQKDIELIKILAKYINNSFERRESFLSNKK